MISFRRKNVKINYDSKNKGKKHRVNDEIIGYDKVRIIGDDIEIGNVALDCHTRFKIKLLLCAFI